jgi:hypothetical protein
LENWIERVTEPRRLFLAWQPSNLDADRFRWVVGILEPRGSDGVLRYVESGQEFSALNSGRSFEQLAALGYQGYPAFNPRRAIHEDGVVATFMRRLPPRSREDFFEYTRQFRLKPNAEVSDFALLAVTEAKLPNDGFSLVDPLDPASDWCDLMLEIAGYRHYAPKLLSPISVGDSVSLMPEPSNKFDPSAVKICRDNLTIGYVNRLQADTFRCWLANHRLSATIERLNGRPDRPRAFVFVRVRPRRASAAA